MPFPQAAADVSAFVIQYAAICSTSDDGRKRPLIKYVVDGGIVDVVVVVTIPAGKACERRRPN